MSAEKSSKKGLIILIVGIMIGIGVGVATCATMMSHQNNQAVAANTGNKAKTAIEAAPSTPPPSLFPLPSQLAANHLDPQNSQQVQPDLAPSTYQSTSYQANAYQANSYQTNSDQCASLQPQQQQIAPLQTQDGSLMMPGVNTVDTSPIVVTAGSANPNWTVGRNGLVQNPCVDPPSAHGRQTGQY